MLELFKLLKRLGMLRKYVFLLLFRAPFDGCRTWMLANIMKTVFQCLETGSKDKLLVECMVCGLLCALLFSYNGIIWSIYAAFAAKTEVSLQKLLINKWMHMPYKRVNSHLSGEWLTRLNSDVNGAFMMMNGPINIPHAVVSLINLLVSSLLMLRGSLLLFGITWLFVLPHLLFHYKVLLKHLPGLKEKSQETMAECTSAIEPLITEADAILVYDAGELLRKQCEECSRRLLKRNIRIHMRNALSDIAGRVFGIAGYLTILLVGFGFVYKGLMTFSEVVYCFQIRGSILAAVFLLLSCIGNMKTNTVCVKRVADALEKQMRVAYLQE